MGAGLLWSISDVQAGGPDELSSLLPIDRTRGDQERFISGDDPHRAHTTLWATQHGENTLPKVDPLNRERVKVAIIGGGCAGLSAAWKLRDLKPVILEQAQRLGGNAKGETWRGLPYSIGAAYLCKPEAGSEIERFLNEVGAAEQMRSVHHESRFLPRGDQFTSLTQILSSATEEERQAWQSLISTLKSYANEEDGKVFPEIPTDEDTHRAMINEMDHEDFSTLCTRSAGGQLPPKLQAYLEQYCWTAFGAGMNEISAASGVNFLAGEQGDLLVGPGGNSWITERATHRLAGELGLSNLRVNSLVYHVEVVQEGVLVTYVDSAQQQRQLLADRVLLACPKFVVKRILKGIESTRLEAINQIKYRAYLVHQALIKAQLKDDFYELFLLGESSADQSLSLEERSRRAGATDLTYGNFASVSSEHTVLSLYQALPYDSGRGQVYQDISLSSQRTEIQKRLHSEILPALKLPSEALMGLRSSRWGHALPVAAPGLINRGVVDELRRPHLDRIFFAHQDNWALPAIEVSLYEGMRAAELIKRSL